MAGRMIEFAGQSHRQTCKLQAATWIEHQASFVRFKVSLPGILSGFTKCIILRDCLSMQSDLHYALSANITSNNVHLLSVCRLSSCLRRWKLRPFDKLLHCPSTVVQALSLYKLFTSHQKFDQESVANAEPLFFPVVPVSLAGPFRAGCSGGPLCASCTVKLPTRQPFVGLRKEKTVYSKKEKLLALDNHRNNAHVFVSGAVQHEPHNGSHRAFRAKTACLGRVRQSIVVHLSCSALHDLFFHFGFQHSNGESFSAGLSTFECAEHFSKLFLAVPNGSK